jgi:hypothetical protein
VHDFTLTVVAGSIRRAGGLDVLVDLQRNLRDGGYEDHQFVPTRGIRFEVARDLGSARVRADLGGYGTVELTLLNAKARGDHGCHRRIHTGVLRGTLRLIPGGTYFGTIKLRRLSAVLSLSVACPTAADVNAPRTGYVPQFMFVTERPARNPGHAQLSWSAENGDVVLVDLIRPGRTRVKDEISVTYPSYKLSEAPGLSRATFTAHGSLLTGAAHYRAKRHLDTNDSTGTVSGTLTALFHTPGPQSLTGPRFHAQLTG